MIKLKLLHRKSFPLLFSFKNVRVAEKGTQYVSAFSGSLVRNESENKVKNVIDKYLRMFAHYKTDF